MGKGAPKKDLWDTTLDWMEKIHGQSLEKDKKDGFRVLLDHLDILMDRAISFLEDNFIPLDIKAINEAGIVPLIVPDNLSPILGSSYILQSEANEDLRSIFEPVDIKEEISSDEEEDDDNMEDDPHYDDSLLMEEEDEGAYTCAKCATVTSSYDELVEHLQTKCVPKSKAPKEKRGASHSIEDRTCKCCSRTFSTLKYLKYSHSKKCSDSQSRSGSNSVKIVPLNCDNCNKSYKTVSHYYLHMKTCGKEESGFENVDTRRLNDMCCIKCGFIAKSKEEYLASDHQCQPNKRYQCSKCDFKTCHPGSFRNHNLAKHHDNSQEFVCDICGAIYSYKHSFTRHLKRHFDKPAKIPCPHCGKSYSGRFTLKRHLEGCNQPPQQHPCEICGKIYTTITYMKRHIRSQHPESGVLKKHECIHCHSSFREKSYLRKHIRKKHSNV